MQNRRPRRPGRLRSLPAPRKQSRRPRRPGRLRGLPLKGKARCDEKVANEYDGEYDRIVDCVRCSIVVETEAQLMSVASQLGSAGVDVSALTAASSSAGAAGGGGHTRTWRDYAA